MSKYQNNSRVLGGIGICETNKEWKSSLSTAHTHTQIASNKLIQFEHIEEKHTSTHTHTHLKTSAIMIIHIDNIAKRTEKRVGEMTLFRITTHTHT